VSQASLFRETSDAEFSPCRAWRYALSRCWGEGQRVAFIGLNPSTADETINDPTIRRCIQFAKDWGFGGLYMLNLYAFRATKPLDMVMADDPVGPQNDFAIKDYAGYCSLHIAAWGALATRYRPRVNWQTRIGKVESLISKPLHCLGYTSDRSPRHPLYRWEIWARCVFQDAIGKDVFSARTRC
jgi:hypothetical protein